MLVVQGWKRVIGTLSVRRPQPRKTLEMREGEA